MLLDLHFLVLRLDELLENKERIKWRLGELIFRFRWDHR